MGRGARKPWAVGASHTASGSFLSVLLWLAGDTSVENPEEGLSARPLSASGSGERGLPGIIH